MKFPTRQSDIAQVAQIMVKGYYNHSEDFPSVSRKKLFLKLRDLKNAVKNQIDKRAVLSEATKNKNEKLDILVKMMKNLIQKSLVDTKSKPAKMSLIGWGPRANPHPKSVPGPPKDLIAEKRDNRLYLFWKKSSSDIIVKCYIIERRIQSKVTRIFWPWYIVGTSIDTCIELEKQLKRVKLEYRVIAVNTAGKSMPSNTITLIL